MQDRSYRYVVLSRDCRYGKKGSRVQFSDVVADQLVKDGFASETQHQAVPTRVRALSNKSMTAKA